MKNVFKTIKNVVKKVCQNKKVKKFSSFVVQHKGEMYRSGKRATNWIHPGWFLDLIQVTAHEPLFLLLLIPILIVEFFVWKKKCKRMFSFLFNRNKKHE